MWPDATQVHEGFERRPLRNIYAAVYVAQMDVSHACFRSSTLLWLAGVARDTRPEVLGVWEASNADRQQGSAVAQELLKRGMKKIGFVVRRAPDEVSSAVLKELPEAVAAHSLPDGSSLFPRVRTSAQRLETEISSLEQGVCRALVQHGPFESAAVAAAFAEAWLLDAEDAARRRRLAAVRRSELAGLVAPRGRLS